MKQLSCERTTSHYFTRQEIFRIYSELRLKYPDGVNLHALFHALLRHPNLSRPTRHIGNNFDQYMAEDTDVARMSQIRQDFDEVMKAYDHELHDAVTIELTCPVMQAFWIAALSDEIMDFTVPFIRFTTMALCDAIINFFRIYQEEHGGLQDVESKLFEGAFSFSGRGVVGPEINVPQLLWDAMIDRDVAKLYTTRYITSLMIEADEGNVPPPNAHLH